VKVLLKHGAPLNTQDELGRTPLIYAVMSGQTKVVRRLVQHDAASIRWKDNCGRTAMSWAAQGRDSEILALLLVLAPDIANMKDTDGWSPLAWTLDSPERPRNAEMLLSYVADELKDGDWVSVFVIALRWRALKVAQLMIKNEVLDINAKDDSGRTALWHAVDMGDVVLVKQILATPRLSVMAKPGSCFELHDGA
jgi:ankyrin repeat protein